MKRQLKHILHDMGRHCRCLSKYSCKDHILVLGSGQLSVSIVKAVAHDEQLRDRPVLILAHHNPRALHEYIFSQLTPEEQKVDFGVMRGERSHDEALKACKVEKASHIFIIGEDDEEERDSLNVACWKHVRAFFEAPHNESQQRWSDFLSKRKEQAQTSQERVAQCRLYLFDDCSEKLFHALQPESHTCLETMVVNYHEDVLRQLLVKDSLTEEDYTLDRGLVSHDNERYVHLFVFGRTPMGCAMATTAAHLCHFPNFDAKAARPLRTKITFVDPQADGLMNLFKARYAGLFDLSRYVLRPEAGTMAESAPREEMGDFLDVEWEFVKGSSVDTWVREMLSACAKDDREVLSVAVCGEGGQHNLNEAIALPDELFVVPEDCDERTNGPVVYVYQPECIALAQAAHNEVPRYKNLVPFGAFEYNPFDEHRMNAAKRVNYLSQKDPKHQLSIPEASALDNMWRQLSYDEKMMRIRFADNLFTQLRGVMSLLPQDGADAQEPLLERLACVEQNRWNVERLLSGYKAMPAARRQELNAAMQSGDDRVRREAKIQSIRNCNFLFVLKDIAPYHDLPQERRSDYLTLFRNIMQAEAKMVRTIQSSSRIVYCRNTDNLSTFPEI